MDNKDGLIFAFLIDTNGKGDELDWQGINSWTPSQGLIWLHLDYNHESTLTWLNAESGLDPIVIEALIAEETRPRYALIDHGLLITLRGINLNPGAAPEDMVAIRLWFDKNRIISTRRRALPSEIDMKKAIISGQSPISTPEFLTDLSYHMIEHMSDIIENISNEVSTLATTLSLKNISTTQQKLTDLRKKIISLRRYLAPQRDVMLRLAGDRQLWFETRDRLHLKEIAEIIIRYIEDLDEATAQLNITQEQILSRISDMTNKRMYLLSIIASIFLPLSFVTGLLGINVGGIPGANNPVAFDIVAISLITTAIILFILLKLKKWM